MQESGLERQHPDQNEVGYRASLVAQMVKNLPRFDSWVGKVPWRRNGNPLQYSCLENPMDRGAWRATVHGAAKSQTQLNFFHRASGKSKAETL